MWERASSAEPRKAEDGYAAGRLAERRRLRRRRGLIAFLILLLLLLATGVWGLWQSSVRISQISADAPLKPYAENALQGSYFGIIPRDSIFFFPASHIRSQILADHSGVAAVSISRDGFTGITIKTNNRVPVARWCGVSPEVAKSDFATSSPRGALGEDCYVFDANGFIFATATTSMPTLNIFTLYAPLVGETLEPLRTTVAHAEKLPAVFDFARQLDTLGSPVAKVVIRDDEIDDYLYSGTRITYVLGHEDSAFTALVSAKGNINFSDGSLEYIDLRFDGKVYLKKK